MRWGFGICISVLAFQQTYGLPDQIALKANGVLDNVRRELVNADIIPEVIGNFDPKYFLSVLWPSNKTANLGNAIIPDDVQDEPAVEIQNVDDGSIKTSSHATITVAMTDPDAPSRDDPKWSEFCHWIVTGLGTSKSNCVSSSKSGHTDVMSYRPPSPPEKTGFHRYVFLAFEAKNGTSKKLHLTKPDDRKHWGTGKKRHGVRNWADDNDLVPVAANFIYVQNPKQH